ncbi:MAG: fumarate hydratase [Deltaproteobacteria bacterium]|nr:fumarate hydratase [Deltaproteobacteria bacterium]RLA90948.1 MAG: fumarate hydratase [Deltaproteobacteria bacterium]
MSVREISVDEITKTIRRLCMESNTDLGDDVIEAYKKGLETEDSPVAKDIFRQYLENAKISKEEGIALCQDTGLAVVFVELGQDVHIVGGDLYKAIDEGVRQGYKDGYLRPSSLDPLTRKNFGDNTPAIVHIEMVPGDKLKLTVAPKGFGSENMSRVVLFAPAVGVEGVKKYIIQRVDESGPNPCPPVVVGVGIGGTFEKAALIAKKAITRPLGQRNPNPDIAKLELELLEEINKLGIGPQGLGGKVTAFDVHIETYPTHIASIPVAVNIQCHCDRHKEAVL